MSQGLAHDSGLTHRIIGLAMRVHRRLGPGLLESVYQKCLCHELTKAGIAFQSQVSLPVLYDGVVIDWGYTADIIVDGQVILELKAVERTQPLHEAQLLTYLRLSPCRVGLLINFNTVSLTDGIKRCVLWRHLTHGGRHIGHRSEQRECAIPGPSPPDLFAPHFQRTERAMGCLREGLRQNRGGGAHWRCSLAAWSMRWRRC
jgi:GxxExxY protein